MQRDTDGSPDACADRDCWAEFILSISHNLRSSLLGSESYLADFWFFPAIARRSVFLRRAARFLTLSLPLEFPITLTDCITCHAAARGRRKAMSPVPLVDAHGQTEKNELGQIER
jgi:hypothetical protein